MTQNIVFYLTLFTHICCSGKCVYDYDSDHVLEKGICVGACVRSPPLSAVPFLSCPLRILLWRSLCHMHPFRTALWCGQTLTVWNQNIGAARVQYQHDRKKHILFPFNIDFILHKYIERTSLYIWVADISAFLHKYKKS